MSIVVPKKNGFTLVEAIVVTALTILVLVVLNNSMTGGRKVAKKGFSHLDRLASINRILEYCKRSLRFATSIEIDDSQPGVKSYLITYVDDVSGPGSHRLTANMELKTKRSGNTTKIQIRHRGKKRIFFLEDLDFSFQLRENLATITLTYLKGRRPPIALSLFAPFLESDSIPLELSASAGMNVAMADGNAEVNTSQNPGNTVSDVDTNSPVDENTELSAVSVSTVSADRVSGTGNQRGIKSMSAPSSADSPPDTSSGTVGSSSVNGGSRSYGLGSPNTSSTNTSDYSNQNISLSNIGNDRSAEGSTGNDGSTQPSEFSGFGYSDWNNTGNEMSYDDRDERTQELSLDDEENEFISRGRSGNIRRPAGAVPPQADGQSISLSIMSDNSSLDRLFE